DLQSENISMPYRSCAGPGNGLPAQRRSRHPSENGPPYWNEPVSLLIFSFSPHPAQADWPVVWYKKYTIFSTAMICPSIPPGQPSASSGPSTLRGSPEHPAPSQLARIVGFDCSPKGIDQ